MNDKIEEPESMGTTEIEFKGDPETTANLNFLLKYKIQARGKPEEALKGVKEHEEFKKQIKRVFLYSLLIKYSLLLIVIMILIGIRDNLGLYLSLIYLLPIIIIDLSILTTLTLTIVGKLAIEKLKLGDKSKI